MATPKIKATYSLDAHTMRVLERVAKRWGVSKSEALRRAIKASEELPAAQDERLSALGELQSRGGVDARAAGAWIKKVRAERRARE
jgi:Zn-dependent peptidase ImmA (M78 family)